MAFYTKYRILFKDLSNNDCEVDLLQDNSTPYTITDLKGDLSPFIVNYPTVDKLSYKKGSGCEINLVSETDRQLLDLYTIDMLNTQIRFYVNSGLTWCGYLDSELYNEPYNQTKNYPVNLSGNDGLNLLSRIYYLQSDGNKYTGISSQWDVLKNILGKLNLPYNYINIGISTVFTTGYDSSLSANTFTQTYVHNANFYNEDGEPETLDTVLKAILEPYGATLFQADGELYILDLNTLYNSTLSYKRYNSNTYSYISSPSTSNAKDLSVIGYQSTASTLAIASGINKQIIKFSPYSRFVNFKYPTSDSTEFSYVADWVLYNNWYTQTVTPTFWTLTNNGGFRGSKGDASSKPDYYIFWTNDNNPSDVYDNTNIQVVAKYDGDTPYIIGSTGSSISISFKSLCRIKNNPYNQDETTSGTVIKYQLKAKIQIGSKYYDGVTESWTTDSSKYEFINMGVYDASAPFDDINDSWQNIRWDALSVPLEDGLQGELKISFLSNFSTFDENGSENYDFINVQEIWVKDIEIKLTKTATGDELTDEDIEYVGYLNSLYQNSGEEKKLLCGTNINNNPVALGGLLRYTGSNYVYIDEWLRNTESGAIEEILLNTIVSNYSGSTLQLDLTVTNTVYPQNIITDSTYLSGKKFMITSYVNDYSLNSVQLKLNEFNQDSLNINRI